MINRKIVSMNLIYHEEHKPKLIMEIIEDTEDYFFYLLFIIVSRWEKVLLAKLRDLDWKIYEVNRLI